MKVKLQSIRFLSVFFHVFASLLKSMCILIRIFIYSYPHEADFRIFIEILFKILGMNVDSNI